MQQEKNADSAHFVTLTYDTEHVPITPKVFLTLKKRDLQLFFKRLRKHYRANQIKYYAVGEYGGKTNRPHYHAIIFGADPDAIEKSWNLGAVHFGTVSGASIGYTLKYISKPPKKIPHWNDKQKEFSLMSKKLGMDYLTQRMVQWHKDDLTNRMYINIGDGKKASMPRYFKDKIYSTEEREAIAAISLIRACEKLANKPLTVEQRNTDDQIKKKNLRQQSETYKDYL